MKRKRIKKNFKEVFNSQDKFWYNDWKTFKKLKVISQNKKTKTRTILKTRDTQNQSRKFN